MSEAGWPCMRFRIFTKILTVYRQFFFSNFPLVTDEIFYDPWELNEIDDLSCAIDSARINSEEVEQCVETDTSVELVII